MKAYDFMFDNRLLSSFGFIICSFSDKGLETVIEGAEITINTVPSLNGAKHRRTSTVYESALECEPIQICKYSCNKGIEEITEIERREITKWLNRKKFFKFKLLDEEHIDVFYEASFNISKIELGGKLYGFELNPIFNTPFALKEPKTIIIKNVANNGKHSINDTSYEEGYIYPYMEIKMPKDNGGDLEIYNAIEDRTTFIKNCVAGEVITMDYPVIQSSISSHNIQNDFNWNWFRIANTYEMSRNDLTISIPCEIKIRYSPIVKTGI